VTELVDRAEEAGLVQRTGDTEDGRVARVELTQAGESRLSAAVVGLRPERRLLFDLLSDVTEQATRLNRTGKRRSRS
jgi:DNA-binding MarR family transcriptional regulator